MLRGISPRGFQAQSSGKWALIITVGQLYLPCSYLRTRWSYPTMRSRPRRVGNKYKQTNKPIWQPHQSLETNQGENLQIDDVFFKTQKWMEISTGTLAGYSSSCPHIFPVSSALRKDYFRLLCYMSFCHFPLYPPPSPYTWFSHLHAKCSHQTLLLQPSSSQRPEQGELGTK